MYTILYIPATKEFKLINQTDQSNYAI